VIFSVKRKTYYENRFNKKMGRLKCHVVKVFKTFLGIPYKKIYHYRETYYGKIKDVKNCDLDK